MTPAHQHVILFGVEVYAGHDSPTEQSPRCPGNAQLVVGLDSQSVCLPSQHTQIGSDGQPPHLDHLQPLVASTSFPLIVRMVSPAPVPTTLCDLARGERSGVRRT